jgi:YesN/AraC family two-component response regulator
VGANVRHIHTFNFALLKIDGNTPKFFFPLISHIGKRNEIVRFFHEFIYTFNNEEPGYMIKTTALFLLIVHRFYEILLDDSGITNANNDSRIGKVKDYIDKHFDQKLTLKKFSSLTSLNPVYLNNIFRKKTGLTMHQYLTKVRVKIAEDLLRSGECTVTQVAERVGYPDELYFSRQFKAVKGIPPSHCMPKKTG